MCAASPGACWACCRSFAVGQARCLAELQSASLPGQARRFPRLPTAAAGEAPVWDERNGGRVYFVVRRWLLFPPFCSGCSALCSALPVLALPITCMALLRPPGLSGFSPCPIIPAAASTLTSRSHTCDPLLLTCMPPLGSVHRASPAWMPAVFQALQSAAVAAPAGHQRQAHSRV